MWHILSQLQQVNKICQLIFGQYHYGLLLFDFVMCELKAIKKVLKDSIREVKHANEDKMKYVIAVG